MISIILPTYNGSKTISKSIESVLGQNFSDWELIIINDASIDNVEDVISWYLPNEKIVYIKNTKNVGYIDIRNIGLQKAKGKYIACIDDDDVWIDENKLKKQFNFLEKQPEYALVGTGVVFINEEGKLLTKVSKEIDDLEIRKIILKKNPFAHSTIMYRKDTAIKYGGYTDIIEDYDLWLKIGRQNKLFLMSDVTTQNLIKNTGFNTLNKRKRLKRNIFLTKENRKYYPSFLKSIIFNYSKYVLYFIYLLLPNFIKKNLFVLYKKIK